jgi:hypothetical protein
MQASGLQTSLRAPSQVPHRHSSTACAKGSSTALLDRPEAVSISRAEASAAQKAMEPAARPPAFGLPPNGHSVGRCWTSNGVAKAVNKSVDEVYRQKPISTSCLFCLPTCASDSALLRAAP